jgi:hypothetical protein
MDEEVADMTARLVALTGLMGPTAYNAASGQWGRSNVDGMSRDERRRHDDLIQQLAAKARLEEERRIDFLQVSCRAS